MFDLNYHTKGKILLFDVLFLCFWRGGAGGDYPRWILHEWRDKRAALIPSLSTASTEQMNLRITIGHWINSPNGNWCDFSRGTVTGTVLAGSPVGLDVNFHWQRWRSLTVLGRFACYASTLSVKSLWATSAFSFHQLNWLVWAQFVFRCLSCDFFRSDAFVMYDTCCCLRLGHMLTISLLLNVISISFSMCTVFPALKILLVLLVFV